jgi:hypothetical protein
MALAREPIPGAIASRQGSRPAIVVAATWRSGSGTCRIHARLTARSRNRAGQGGYLSNAFTTLDGRQVIVLINATGSTLTVQQNAELGDALSAGLCGDLGPPWRRTAAFAAWVGCLHTWRGGPLATPAFLPELAPAGLTDEPPARM